MLTGPGHPPGTTSRRKPTLSGRADEGGAGAGPADLAAGRDGQMVREGPYTRWSAIIGGLGLIVAILGVVTALHATDRPVTVQPPGAADTATRSEAARPTQPGLTGDGHPVAGTAAAAGSHTTLTLDSIYDATPDGGGYDTGLTVAVGDLITIQARGTIVYGYEGGLAGNCAGLAATDPDGNRTVDGVPCDLKFDEFCPSATAPVGALIGRIGDSGWFRVGSNLVVRATRTGSLWLAHNDHTPTDNTGSFEVSVQITHSG